MRIEYSEFVDTFNQFYITVRDVFFISICNCCVIYNFVGYFGYMDIYITNIK